VSTFLGELQTVPPLHLTRRENVLFVGPSGSGKTHLATALGLEVKEAGDRHPAVEAEGVRPAQVRSEDRRSRAAQSVEVPLAEVASAIAHFLHCRRLRMKSLRRFFWLAVPSSDTRNSGPSTALRSQSCANSGQSTALPSRLRCAPHCNFRSCALDRGLTSLPFTPHSVTKPFGQNRSLTQVSTGREP